MLRYPYITKLFLTIITILSLSSCGGGGGGGDSSPQSRDTGTVSGIVFDAPVSQAVVTAYEYQDGKVGRKLGSATTTAYGEYSIEVDAASMPLYIEAKGGAYKDPLTDEVIETSEGKPIRIVSVINYGEGNDQDVMLTPLTYMVAGLAEYKIKQGEEASRAVDDALNTINAMYGFNVNSVKPIDITKEGISGSASDGHLYGALLTAYSSYAYDLIGESGNAGNVYSSLNLSDIGYRDIVADGLLNGSELIGSFDEDIYFGEEKVTPDTYTNQMAEHTLVVVSDPDLNVSNTPVEDYLVMAEHLNALGTNGSTDGAIPAREETVIDEEPPVAIRDGDGVLKGTESIDITLTDTIGIQSAEVTLKHKFDSGEQWTDVICSAEPAEGDICWLDTSEFVEGPRETSLKVYVDTEQLDPESVEASPEAYLLIHATDVLGNGDGPQAGSQIPFEWDNIAPIIEITSAETINSEAESYVLQGLVKEDPNLLKDGNVLVSLSNGKAEPYSCEEVFGDEIWCKFETVGYLTDSFGEQANFEITAEDIHGNVGTHNFTLYNDNTPPTLYLEYPNVLFDFENEQGVVYEREYSDITYNSDSVETATEYLKVLYDYASKGLAITMGEIDDDLEFTDFIAQDLVDQSVPYVAVTITDQNGSETYGSSAENLTLRVKYYSKKEGEDEYHQHITTEQVASKAEPGENKGIPFKKLEHEADGTVPQMTYYVPYVKEVLGVIYGNKTPQDRQKLVISTLDASGNESEPQEVYYRTSFDMPEVTIVTPFIDASVRLEGLSDLGAFNYIDSCDTVQVDGQKDVASCTIAYDSSGYEFFRVYLSDKGGETHYYQWSNNTFTKVTIPDTGDIGAYFSAVDENTVYITEFSSYHTGLFDSQWDKLDGADKTAGTARKILADVNSALDSQPNSMLGFDPVTTKYATNKMLEDPLPEPLSDEYIYRFLLESLTNMAESQSANSLNYALAFYQDLSHDGKANGEGSSGSIKIGNYELSSATYREELAQGYYDVAHGMHNVDSMEALEQANHFATANPTFSGEDIFDDEGGSIDQEAPSVNVTPNLIQQEGAYTEAGGTDYNIAGKVHSKVTIEDIATVNERKTELSAHWVNDSKKKTLTDIEFILNNDESTEYKKVYDFTIDSLASDFSEAERFEIVAKVEDGFGNFEGPYVASTYYVDNEPPAGSITAVAPEHPTEADNVIVTLQFEEPVKAVTATFDGIDIDFGESQDFKELWTGTTSQVISLNPNENSKQLVVSNYHDELNNVGAEFSEDIIVTPVITIDNVTEDNIVSEGEDDVTNITFSGTTTGFLKDSELSVKVVSDKRPNIDKFEFTGVKVNQDGTWSIPNQDMSNWEESDFIIEVRGRNSGESEEVVEEKNSEYIDSIKPEVLDSQISMSGTTGTIMSAHSEEEVLIDGEVATVTLTFSERVSQPEAVLNGQVITFSQLDDVAKIWVGTSPELILPDNSSTSKLVVTNYQDTASSPNLGDSFEKPVDVKPVITIPNIDDLSTSEADAFVISGSSKGFEDGAELSVAVSSDNPLNDELDLTATVSEGAWATLPQNLSSWESGTLNITVNGMNDHSHAADEASQDVELQDDIVPEVSTIIVNSGDPIIDNQTAFVSVTFSERVENVVANVDGVNVNFVSRDGAKTVWEGATSDVVTVNANEMFKTVTVTQYQDAQGNSGQEDSTEAPVKPVIEITERGGPIDEQESRQLVIEGTARGFQANDEVTVVARLSGSAQEHHFEETVVVAQNGAWSTSPQNIRDWPSGDINLTVVGLNNNGVAADTATDTITYTDTTLPQLVGEIAFEPVVPEDGKKVTITANFSELVTNVTATVGGVDVVFTGNEPAQQWVGQTEEAVTLSSNDDTITAVVNTGYKDISDNIAVSDKETSTVVKPIILISDIDDLTTTEAQDFVVSGSARGFENGAELDVVVSSNSPLGETFSDTVTVTEGAWATTSEDISSWESGILTITVDGSNEGGQAALQASQDVGLEDDIVPEVSTISVNSGDPIIDNQTAFVSVTFSERVENVVANVDGVNVNFVSRDGAKTVWEGTTSDVVTVNANEMLKTVTVTQYQDAQGNSGQEGSTEAPVKPVIEITERGGPIDEQESRQLVIAGTARGFQANDEVTVVARLNGSAQEYHFEETVVVAQNGAWSTSPQNIRDWPSGDINLTVVGLNNNGVAADTATDTITYTDATLPQVVGEIAFEPAVPEDGKKVTITANFSELVTNVTATVGGVDVVFTGNEPAQQWVGQTDEAITLSSNEDTIIAVVNAGYQDLSGNEAGSDKETSTVVKPVILMQGIPDLSTNEAQDFVVSGSARGFENGAELAVVVSSNSPLGETFSDTVTVAEGVWATTSEDISSWESGILTITVDGSNEGGQAALQASQDVGLEDDIVPEVSTISVNSGDPIIDNQTAFVSVTFSERVENVVANVDGVNVNFVSRDGAKTVWEGTTSDVVTVNANEMLKTVTVTQYQDAQGNSGQEDSTEAPVKPVIEITERGGPIEEQESRQLVIEGTARGFQANDEVTVVARLSGSAQEHRFEETVVVAQNGAWSTLPQNIRDWPSGDINLTVVGLNNNGVAADTATDTITYTDATLPQVVGEIAFEPVVPEDGKKVTITANFSELVTNVTATVGGVDVVFTGNEPAQQWVGQTDEAITLSSNDDTIIAVVNAGYQDLSGNEAGSDKETATGVKPVLSLDTVEGNNEIDSEEAKHVVIQGTGIGFAGDTKMITVTVTSQEEPSFIWQETVSISEAGVWATNSGGQDISDWPMGLITVEVTGTNQQGIAAELVTNSSVSIVDTLPPTVTEVESLTPSVPEEGSIVSLTVNFDEPVKGLSGSFAGVPMTFTKVTMGDDISEQWAGQTSSEINLTPGSATEEFVLNTFEDASGNTVGQVYKEPFFVKPLIEIEPVTGDSVIDAGEAGEFYITGQSKGIEHNGTLTVKVKRNFSTKLDEVVTVTSDGSWSTGKIDATNWNSGEFEVQVSGNNSGNVSADQATQTITVQ
ncbi:hypothetical protein CTT30_21600 [Vibrio coralliilyticus]|nr:hypothetical protein CTT30_21600 [Vibrio coralliilyticus]